MAIADTQKVGAYTWSYSVAAGKATVTGVSPKSGTLEIPSRLGNYNVTGIGSYAFYHWNGGYEEIKSVVIPNGVVHIGEHAFSSCTGLESVSIPYSVQEIGAVPFSGAGVKVRFLTMPGCFRLTVLGFESTVEAVVTISEGSTNVCDSAFQGCTNLTAINIPDSVVDIGKSALKGCSSITNVVLGNGVRNIGEYAFSGCSNLKRIAIPNGVSTINTYSFENCRQLVTVSLPNSLTDIAWGSFDGCSSLNNISIPNNVERIGSCAFYNCNALSSVTIGNKVVSIGGDVFKNCNEGLFDTNTLSGVKLVDGWAVGYNGGLSGDLDLSHIRGIAEDALQWCRLDSVLIDGICNIANSAFRNSSIKRIKVGDGVKNIDDDAFFRCNGLLSVEIGNGVTNIGRYAFNSCSSLTNLMLGISVQSIGNNAFTSCYGLSSLMIPDSVTSIGGRAFAACSGLVGVTIPCNVTSIGDAFYLCNGLTNVTLRNCMTDYDANAIPENAEVTKCHDEYVYKVARVPVCTDVGWTCEIRCHRCSAILEASETLPALGHDGVETVAAIAPTCTTDGRTHEVSCSRCDAILETSSALTKLGHWGVERKTARAPTCTDDGWTHEMICNRCNVILAASSVVPKLGHLEVETKAAKAATCTEAGWTHEMKCSRCNTILEVSVELPKIPHVEVETKAAKAATCTEAGWTHEVKCSRCDAVLEASTTIPALGHVRQTTISAIEPTCTTDGRTAEVVCSRCGVTFETSEVIPSFGGHSGAITKPAVEPTSSTAGKTAEITCSRCGEILQAQTTIPALGYIRNVRAAQLWPHKKIALQYELADDINEVVASTTVPTVKGTYGSTTKTATNAKIYGDKSCTSGIHHIVWDVEGDSITHTQKSMSFTIGYGSKSATTTCWVALGSDVKNGMTINGAKKNVWYSPFGNGEVQLLIDGNVFLSSTNLDVFAWIPQATGTHSIVHKSGSYTWTRTLTVSSLTYDTPPAPNPPTAADANIAIGTTLKSFAVGGGSGTITTSGSGTWSASASDDWITIPLAMASRNAGLPVVYQVKANSSVEERAGYIYVSGHVFTITQVGVGGELDAYSADFETDGGTGSFTVLADAQTSWKARSNVDWISVTVEGTGNGEWGTAGVGEQRVIYNVAPWNEVSTRSGTITAAGCTFTVNQTGRRMKLVVADGGAAGAERQPYQLERDYLSHVIDVQVNALASTDWDIELDGTWISIVDAGTGHGAGSVALAINENPSWLARSGMVRIGSEWLTINQAGRPSNALDFSISPENTTASVKGANALISVMATPDLPWTATSQANWLTIMPSFQDGAGNGNVVYTASPNPTMANRSGTIKVAAVSSAALAAKTHRVTQPAATSMVSDDACVFDAGGESHAVEVTVDDIVNWTVSENISWLSVVESTSRIGPGSVTLVASENLTVNPREANLTIAGHPFHVVQKGRTVEVEYTSRVFGTASDYASIDVHPDGNVQWTAVSSDPSWLTIWGDDGCEYDDYGNVIATGDHTIEYIVSDYVGDGTPRTAIISIGDKTVYITQRAYELSINPSSEVVGGNAGTGSVGVPATAGQIWNAIATEPWITVVSGYDSGTGSGTVRYTYTDNDTGEERTGRIIIAGEEYTITQAARQMVAVNVTTRVVTGSGEQGTGNGGVVSGAGTYDRGTSVTLTAVANDGYSFVNWMLPNGSIQSGGILATVADVDKEIIANFRRIPVYSVNGEGVREGTSKTFIAPADVIDDAGTTKLVCLGTSRYPDKGTSFTLVVTEDISFEWDLWQTNYLVAVSQSSGGAIKNGSSLAPTTAWYPAGSTIDLTATPNSGKSFFRWNLPNPDNPVNPVENISAHSGLCVNTPTAVSAVFGTFDDTLATALDAPALTFTTGGDAEWQPVIDATAQTGYTSARSGVIGAESETWLDTTVEGAGTLTFRWRVDCEKDDGGGATWDRLAVFTNGVEAARIDGKTDWQTVTIELPNSPTPNSPTQTLIRWSFYRDDFDEPGQSHENCGWVDGIIWQKADL